MDVPIDTPVGSVITIRQAIGADIPDIQRVLVETWHTSYDAIMGVDEVTRLVGWYFSVDAIEARVLSANRNRWFGVAHDGGGVAGIACAQCNIFGRVTVWMIYVHPDHQGQGIGTRLLYAIAEQFPFARSVFVEVLEANRDAIRFYERNGFQKAGVHNNPMRANVPILRMRQTVPNAVSPLDAVKWYLARVL